MKSLLLALLGFIGFVGGCSVSPKATDDYSKRIVGRWLGPRKVSVFHSNGTWGVQRHEEAPEEINGRRWRIEGNKLFLTFRGDHGLQTVDFTIISFTPKSYTIDSDGYKQVYERIP